MAVTSIEERIAWLTAQIDEDELWALAASAPHHGDGPTVAGGVHWTWAVGGNWTQIDVDPLVEYVGEGHDEHDGGPSLITTEVFPFTWDPTGQEGQVLVAEEVRTGDGGHIVRHDPARVLAEVAAKRQIVDHAEGWAQTLHHTPDGWTEATATAYRMAMEWTLRALALPYADRPGFPDEWQPA